MASLFSLSLTINWFVSLSLLSDNCPKIGNYVGELFSFGSPLFAGKQYKIRLLCIKPLQFSTIMSFV